MLYFAVATRNLLSNRIIDSLQWLRLEVLHQHFILPPLFYFFRRWHLRVELHKEINGGSDEWLGHTFGMYSGKNWENAVNFWKHF